MSNNTCKYVVVKPKKLNHAAIKVYGYKHAATLMIAAAIICPDTNIILNNIPQVKDIFVLAEIINKLGGEAKLYKDQLILNTKNLHYAAIPEELSKQVHATLYLIPAFLARFGKISLGECGGCPIGKSEQTGHQRPTNHVLQVLEQFSGYFKNTSVQIEGECKTFKATTIDIAKFSNCTDKLTGPYVSGATKTAILGAMAVNEGETIILNPYLKSDIVQLLNFVKLLGFDVSQKDNSLKIKRGTIAKEVVFEIMPDINEIFTYIVLAIYNNFTILLNDIDTKMVILALNKEIQLLQNMGIELKFEENSIYVPLCKNVIRSADVIVSEAETISVYTDNQPFVALLLLLADKKGSITELVWEGRFQYAEELIKMGHKFDITSQKLTIYPQLASYTKPLLLKGKDVRSTAAIIIAALKGIVPVVVTGIEHLERGYYQFFNQLRLLGAEIYEKEGNPLEEEILQKEDVAIYEVV